MSPISIKYAPNRNATAYMAYITACEIEKTIAKTNACFLASLKQYTVNILGIIQTLNKLKTF